MTYPLPENWPLPNDFMLELGRLSTLFGSLESGVNLGISKLLGYEKTLDWRAAIVTAHANFKQRVDMLETLCHELAEEYPHLSGYEEVLGKIKKAQARRNKYMHNSLYYDAELDQVMASSLSARGQMKPRVEVISITELRNLSGDIHLSMLDLHRLITTAEYSPIWETKQ
jgi:hypothetical protein